MDQAGDPDRGKEAEAGLMKTFYAQMVGLVAGTIAGWLTIFILAQVVLGAYAAMVAGPVVSICLYKVISERFAEK